MSCYEDRAAECGAVLRSEAVRRAAFRPTSQYRGGRFVPSVYVPSHAAIVAALELARLTGAPLPRLY
jgi:hypothetical protein